MESSETDQILYRFETDLKTITLLNIVVLIVISFQQYSTFTMKNISLLQVEYCQEADRETVAFAIYI